MLPSGKHASVPTSKKCAFTEQIELSSSLICGSVSPITVKSRADIVSYMIDRSGRMCL